MNRKSVRLLLGVALPMIAIQGCQHACRQPCAAAPPAAVAGVFAAPAAPQAVPQAPGAPVPVPAAIRGYEPPLATPAPPSWRPSADGGIRLAPPEDTLSGPTQAGARLQVPDLSPPPPRPSNLGEEGAPTPLLPAGIPQFAIAKDQIAVGLKPMLDGIDWLSQNGYRTVLHLRQPGEDDAAERKLFEMRGFKFLSLELSPQTLSRASVDEFNRIVGERANLPLFIYDTSGVLTGSLWYLHFREAMRLSDEDARTRATRLGLKETPNGLQREMWLAIQNFLAR